ncbi:hypothetical protein CHCC14821_2233 [Bacillus paralicheniformis]|nr:hypothetical protein CHCC14821_2233 [Bacillus paralicheniformis]
MPAGIEARSRDRNWIVKQKENKPAEEGSPAANDSQEEHGAACSNVVLHRGWTSRQTL